VPAPPALFFSSERQAQASWGVSRGQPQRSESIRQAVQTKNRDRRPQNNKDSFGPCVCVLVCVFWMAGMAASFWLRRRCASGEATAATPRPPEQARRSLREMSERGRNPKGNQNKGFGSFFSFLSFLQRFVVRSSCVCARHRYAGFRREQPRGGLESAHTTTTPNPLLLSPLMQYKHPTTRTTRAPAGGLSRFYSNKTHAKRAGCWVVLMVVDGVGKGSREGGGGGKKTGAAHAAATTHDGSSVQCSSRRHRLRQKPLLCFPYPPPPPH
jgi:hypothetical protein